MDAWVWILIAVVALAVLVAGVAAEPEAQERSAPVTVRA